MPSVTDIFNQLFPSPAALTMYPVSEIQTPRFQQASGYCTNTAAFFEMVNACVDELIVRGDWTDTVIPIRVCIKSGCVTWPRYVGAVRKMNSCRHGIINMRNVWYEFLDFGGPRHIHAWQGWLGHERNALAQAKAPTYNDIYGPNCTVRVYPAVNEDVGATVQIFGIDNNGQPLTTDNGDGTWSQGIKNTEASPFGSTGNAY